MIDTNKPQASFEVNERELSCLICYYCSKEAV